MRESSRSLLRGLASAPPNQIDSEVCEKLLRVETAIDLKKILDECAFGARATDFAMTAMDFCWMQMRSDEKEDLRDS